MTEEQEARFWAKVYKHPDGCWLWTAAVSKMGYPVFNLGKGHKQSNGHRAIYEHIHGPQPSELFCCHTCCVSHCVNPDHLYMDTVQGNDAYRDAMGRHRNGGLGKLPRKYPLPVVKHFTLEERFWNFIEKQPEPDGCWLFTGCAAPIGYGRFSIENGLMEQAHRTSWRLHNGDIPEGMKVLHRCDVRNCCNPSHLFLGTQKQNVDDMEAKGRARHPKGEENGISKLTVEAVLEIRRSYEPGIVTLKQLAMKHLVSAQTILAIVHRRIWKHV